MVFLLIYSCNSKDEVEQVNYVTHNISNKLFENELIENAVFFDRDILILTRKNHLFLLDSLTRSLDLLNYNLDSEIISLIIADNEILCLTKKENLFEIIDVKNKEIKLSFKCNLKSTVCKDIVYLPSNYQDEYFNITSCCVGEWGGAIFFKDKQTGRVYSTESTCLLEIDVFDKSYYIFNYLGHMRGFSSIVKVKDVKKLPLFNPDSSIYWCNWYEDKYRKVKFEDHDSVNRYLLGNSPDNLTLLDTISLRLLSGKVNELGIHILYQSEGRIKKGRINEGKIIDEMVLIDTIMGQIDFARKSPSATNLFSVNTFLGYDSIQGYKGRNIILLTDSLYQDGIIYRIN